MLSDLGGIRSVSGFKDPEFIRAFGPGLDRLPDSELVNQALVLLTEHVAALLRQGKTGLRFFDARAADGDNA